MKNLFAELAASQIRVNRSRTFWTLAAIALATALITCVTHFVASGAEMIATSMGGGLTQYSAAYRSTLVIPAAFLSLLIVVMAVVVISNVFRVSARERTAVFGTLKCVGATPAQIRKTMLWEALLLAAVGIPIGLVLGLALTAGGIAVANHFLDELNALTHIMLKTMTFRLRFVLSPLGLVIAALLALVTVLVSAWLPARKAAKQSAIASVRGQNDVSVRLGRSHHISERIVAKWFGPEGLLAQKTLARSRQTFRTTVAALAVAVVLFIFIGFLWHQAGVFNAMMTPDTGYTVTADYQSATASDASDYTKPITSALGDEITNELAQYDGGTEIYGLGNDYARYDVSVDTSTLSPEIVDYYELDGQQTATFDVECIVIDSAHYAALCADAGVPVGSTLLINNDRLNLKGHATDTKFFAETPQTLTLDVADGSTQEIFIDAVLTAEETPAELFFPNMNPVRIILPEMEHLRQYSWEAAPQDMAGFMDYTEEILAAHFPDQSQDSYMQGGYSARVYATDDYYKVMNVAIVIALIFLVCFCALLMLIGFTNVVSTLSTNVLMRQSEFAVLQSVGMTPEGLRKMLALESIFCSLRALAIGVPLGILLTYVVNLPIRAMFPVPYHFPLLPILLCSAGVLALTLAITALAARRLRSRNIIDRIRSGQRLY